MNQNVYSSNFQSEQTMETSLHFALSCCHTSCEVIDLCSKGLLKYKCFTASQHPSAHTSFASARHKRSTHSHTPMFVSPMGGKVGSRHTLKPPNRFCADKELQAGSANLFNEKLHSYTVFVFHNKHLALMHFPYTTVTLFVG